MDYFPLTQHYTQYTGTKLKSLHSNNIITFLRMITNKESTKHSSSFSTLLTLTKIKKRALALVERIVCTTGSNDGADANHQRRKKG